MAIDHRQEARELLRTKGFRATPGRVQLLAVLDTAGKPLSFAELLEQVSMDTATLYRALPELVGRGILRAVEFNDGISRYEYAPHAPHHHHVVCTDCGTMEDIELCPVSSLREKLEGKTKKFSSISSHSLEFLGLCASCA